MTDLLSYTFFTNAIVASLITSISCGFIGSYIVSRRIVFISGGISHASFGGVGIGYFFGFNPIIGAAVFSIFTALCIESLSGRGKLRTDSLIGIMWSLGMALGLFFVFLTPGYSANLMSFLFGNILTVSIADLYFMAAVTFIIVIFFFFLYKEILYLAFDSEFALTQGIPVKIISLALMALVALTIVISIRVVGIILVISLLTIPQTTANILTHDFKKIIIFSIGFGMMSTVSGLLISFFLNIPSGATIIFCCIAVFLMVKTGHWLWKKAEDQRSPA